MPSAEASCNTMPRLGRLRPDSRKLKCFCDRPHSSDNSSWLAPRARRHSRKMLPNEDAALPLAASAEMVMTCLSYECAVTATTCEVIALAEDGSATARQLPGEDQEGTGQQ